VLVRGTAVDPIKFVAATRQPAAATPAVPSSNEPTGPVPPQTQNTSAAHQLPF